MIRDSASENRNEKQQNEQRKQKNGIFLMITLCCNFNCLNSMTVIL